jgi:hypothetical protein
VNKQEFSASSWRSNQGYTTMHGQATIKIVYQNYNEFGGGGGGGGGCGGGGGVVQ